MNESTATPHPETGATATGQIPAPLTRDRLIRAGREAFARSGFAAASVREITTAADANLGAITYHFGCKQGLYDAVLETVFGPLRERVTAAADASHGAPAPDRIERIVRAMFSVLRANPDLPVLMVQQMAAKQELPGPALQTFPQVFAVLVRVIGEGQAEGTIRAGDPLLLAISTVSQPAYFGVIGRFLLQRLPEVLGRRPEWDEIEEHAVAFVRRALVKHGEAG